jgi:dihydroorotate dehydrogenase
MFYKTLIKPILFLFSPEKAHYMVFSFVKFLTKIPSLTFFLKNIFQVQHPNLKRTLFGIEFPNPVGLAAGFDKNAVLFNELACFGFGFIEIGTLTPLAQPGNPAPRLFRLPKDAALINRMGFNNDGVDVAIDKLKKKKSSIIIGGNIGKNKITPNENAHEDYIIGFEKLFPYVDYFVVNVSSPNTPNLRDLQEKEPLTHLLNKLQEKNNQYSKRKPILLKIAPDLTDSQLDDIIEIIGTTKIDGVIATNTTISRENLSTSSKVIDDIGSGGLSGKPVRDKSTYVIKYLHEKSNGNFPIIGVGGIMSPEDAIEKIKAGASLIQLYTGFIYEGPSLVKNINRAILKEKV